MSGARALSSLTPSTWTPGTASVSVRPAVVGREASLGESAGLSDSVGFGLEAMVQQQQAEQQCVVKQKQAEVSAIIRVQRNLVRKATGGTSALSWQAELSIRGKGVCCVSMVQLEIWESAKQSLGRRRR